MKSIATYIGRGLTIASIGFFAFYLYKYAGTWPSINFSLASTGTIAGLVSIQIFLAAASAMAWRCILSFSSTNLPSYRQSVSIFFKSQFSKYVPGNIAQHIGRALLSKKVGISSKQVLLSITIETLWTIGCGAVIAIYALTSKISDSDESRLQVDSSLLWLIAAIAILGPAIGLPIAFPVLKRWFPNLIPPSTVIVFSVHKSLFSIAIYISSFLFLGIAMNGIATALFGQTSTSLSMLASICALAWIAGFVTPGAPAGIGVRESILLVSLAPIYGPAVSSSLVIAHRLVTALGDFVVYCIGLLLSERNK